MASAPMYGYTINLAIHRISDVLFLRYPPMGADMGVLRLPSSRGMCTFIQSQKFLGHSIGPQIIL